MHHLSFGFLVGLTYRSACLVGRNLLIIILRGTLVTAAHVPTQTLAPGEDLAAVMTLEFAIIMSIVSSGSIP